MGDISGKTLRLLMSEWQGGDYDLSVGSGELYPLGARLLAFLAPKSGEETIEVPVAPYNPAIQRHKENGVMNQDIVINQMLAARKILEEKKPSKVITFGGECLVSQAPFDYLNGLYGDKLGVIWIDAHPDVSTPAIYDQEHAMVLGNLLGDGDPLMAREVKHAFKSEQVLLVGMENFNSPKEEENITKFGLPVLKPSEVKESSQAILDWLKKRQIEYAAIHLDLDSLDPHKFYSQLTNDPDAAEKFPTVLGKLDIQTVTRIIKDISKHTDVVGLTIAEYMPWDAWQLKHMMEQFPIMK